MSESNWLIERELDMEAEEQLANLRPLVNCWYCSKQRHEGGKCECGAPPEMPEHWP